MGAKTVQHIEEIGSECNIIFSLVNSSSTESVASDIAKRLTKGTIYLDLTTSTPQVKLRNEQLITSKGGIYLDIAIMGTVATERHHVPLLIAGEHALQIRSILDDLGFNGQAISHPNGAAASIKLIRSIFMKGLEALIFETMITAEKYSVSDDVMKSISTTINNNDFTEYAHALITTHMLHKHRRYKEVCDSISLIKEANLSPVVTQGVLSFFSRSVNLDMDQNILDSSDVKQILHKFLC